MTFTRMSVAMIDQSGIFHKSRFSKRPTIVEKLRFQPLMHHLVIMFLLHLSPYKPTYKNG